jgi:hypothetical protein
VFSTLWAAGSASYLRPRSESIRRTTEIEQQQ